MKSSIVALAAALLAVQPSPAPLQRLQASIETTTKTVNATWGIYVKSLQTGEEVSVNADRQMETMSTIKIPLMIEVLEQVNRQHFEAYNAALTSSRIGIPRYWFSTQNASVDDTQTPVVDPFTNQPLVNEAGETAVEVARGNQFDDVGKVFVCSTQIAHSTGDFHFD